MIAQQSNLDVISNNLARMSIPQGYKKMRAEFEDLMYQIGREPGRALSSPIDEFPPG